MANVGAGAGGALSGAATGAAVGSIVPGLGTAVGAIGGGLIGGLAGLFSDSGQQSYHVDDPYAASTLSGALANSNQVYGQQQTLAQALQAQAAGQGPNPALSQLHQTTDQNAQAAAGLLASQRGLNPALAARMAAQAQTNANQTAGGQAATLSAEQQLAATGQLSGLYNNMGNQQLTQQQLINQANNDANKINAGVSSSNAQAGATYAGGVMQGVGSLGSTLLTSKLGTGTTSGMPSGGSSNAPGSSPGLGVNTSMSSVPSVKLSAGGPVPGRAKVAGDSTANDTVSAKLSPGEIVIPRSHADNAKDAKDFIDALMSKKKANAVHSGFGKVLEAHRALTQALQAVK